MKEEALKLADEADFISTTIESLEWVRNANLMIRKLVAELDKKPLSDEEIMDIYYSVWNRPMEMEDIEKADITFARAIEERHGIK